MWLDWLPIRNNLGSGVAQASFAAVACAGETKVGTPQGAVPTFDLDWLPGQDSNLRPAGYKWPRSFDRAWTISSPT